MKARIARRHVDQSKIPASRKSSALALAKSFYPFVLSGILALVASPSYGFGFVGWCCLIPFLYGVSHSPNWKTATVGGFLAGAAFFGPGVYWLSSVTTAAWLAL